MLVSANAKKKNKANGYKEDVKEYFKKVDFFHGVFLVWAIFLSI
jgi:hypothetical protein